MIRAQSINNILKKKYDLIPFSGPWLDAFGQPEKQGVWFISGRPTNGKTSFCLQLIKEFGLIGLKTALFSFEEGTSKSFQQGLKRVKMDEVKNDKVVVLELAPFDEVLEWFEGKRIKVAMFDSVQKWRLTTAQYNQLIRAYPNILFIFISHVHPNGLPDGAAAVDIHRDACLKIWVEGYRAINKGREPATKGYFTIWEEGAAAYWAKNINPE